jgi:hypothetical protein
MTSKPDCVSLNTLECVPGIDLIPWAGGHPFWGTLKKMTENDE